MARHLSDYERTELPRRCTYNVQMLASHAEKLVQDCSFYSYYPPEEEEATNQMHSNPTLAAPPASSASGLPILVYIPPVPYREEYDMDRLPIATYNLNVVLDETQSEAVSPPVPAERHHYTYYHNPRSAYAQSAASLPPPAAYYRGRATPVASATTAAYTHPYHYYTHAPPAASYAHHHRALYPSAARAKSPLDTPRSFSESPQTQLQKSSAAAKPSPHASTTASQAKSRKRVDGSCVVSKKRKPKRRKAKDAPKRPLCAYNLFFRDQRIQLMAEKLQKEKQAGGETEESHEPKSVKIGFQALARHVGERWKAADEATKARYQKLAEEEKEVYHRAVAAYLVKKATEGEEEEAGMASDDDDNDDDDDDDKGGDTCEDDKALNQEKQNPTELLEAGIIGKASLDDKAVPVVDSHQHDAMEALEANLCGRASSDDDKSGDACDKEAGKTINVEVPREGQTAELPEDKLGKASSGGEKSGDTFDKKDDMAIVDKEEHDRGASLTECKNVTYKNEALGGDVESQQVETQ